MEAQKLLMIIEDHLSWKMEAMKKQSMMESLLYDLDLVNTGI